MSIHSRSLPKSLMDGILVAGTDFGCGKTAVISGLAAAITAEGFRVQALKPLEFTVRAIHESPLQYFRGQDQAFINKVTQQYIQADTISVSSPWEVSHLLWNKMLEQCKTLQYPCLLEAPGQIASPWHVTDYSIIDALDVVKQLGLSLILVAKAEPSFLDKARLAFSFVKSRNIEPVGFIRVHTTGADTGVVPYKKPPSVGADPRVRPIPPGVGAHCNAPLPPTKSVIPSEARNPLKYREESIDEAMIISQNYSVPFLGDLPYSPSISVSTLQQGNLIRLTQENIDLLPVQMGIGLKL